MLSKFYIRHLYLTGFDPTWVHWYRPRIDANDLTYTFAKSEMILTELYTHRGRVTHICVSKIIIIGLDNGLSPGQRQAIIWTNVGLLLIGPLGINFSEILIEMNKFLFNKMHLKMSSAKWRLFRLVLNGLTNEASVAPLHLSRNRK